ncbi:hypothetical protein [Halocynthiibacter namhaensis]|uniref:AraC-like ligand-binding domain-containing protein n=1 Tax=Halocynthiibacter namhaensis TaxID=1290553 RepID=UPI0005797256|nr:hypothetical protein [Halocynthiibacter namhaensis]
MIFEWSTKAKHGDAFDAWRNDIMLDSTPWAVGSKPTGPFTASHKFLALNGLPMGEVTISGASGHRTAREIRASTVENYTCVVMVSGSQGVSQEQFNRKVSPGEIYLWDSELPCSFECRAKTSQIQISIPKEQIHRVTGGRHLSPNVISSTSGIGAILAQFMATAMKNVTEFSMDQNDRVSEVAMNLILGGFDRQGRPQGNTPRLVV